MQLNYSGSGTIFFKDQEYRCDLYKNTEEGGTMVTKDLNIIRNNLSVRYVKWLIFKVI